MKKVFTSKAFIASVLVCLCVVILGVCWFVSREKPKEFTPDETPQSQQQANWKAPSSNAGTATPGVTPPKEEEAYPKVVEEDKENTVIDFTPPQSSAAESTPPATPEGKTEVTDPGASHPVNKDPQVTPPKEEPPKSNTPAPGSSNEKGEYYDPVFGWIKPSVAEGETVDNDGDPNKMIGSMD